VVFLAKDIPSLGYSTFSIKYQPELLKSVPEQKDKNDTLSNEYWTVKVAKNGGVSMICKINGKIFEKLNILYFCSDKGIRGICDSVLSTSNDFLINVSDVFSTEAYESVLVTVYYIPCSFTVYVGYFLVKGVISWTFV